MTLPTTLVPVTLSESSTTQAHRLSLLLSYRILYTAVSFGLTLGKDVSAKDIGVSRTSFTFNQNYNFNLRVHTQYHQSQHAWSGSLRRRCTSKVGQATERAAKRQKRRRRGKRAEKEARLDRLWL